MLFQIIIIIKQIKIATITPTSLAILKKRHHLSCLRYHSNRPGIQVLVLAPDFYLYSLEVGQCLGICCFPPHCCCCYSYLNMASQTKDFSSIFTL